MLSLRTTFHKRGRLILTVLTLAAGGAAFIAALNVSAAWNRLLESDARTRRYDVDVRLSRRYPIAEIADAIKSVPGIQSTEFWPEAGGMLKTAAGGETRVNVFAPTPGSPFLAPEIIAGRWLTPADTNGVVITQTLLNVRNAALHGGGQALLPVPSSNSNAATRNTLVLRIKDHDTTWRIVGVVRELNPGPTAYVLPSSLIAAAGMKPDTTAAIRVATRLHDERSEGQVIHDLERSLQAKGIFPQGIHSIRDGRQAFADHLVIIKSALMFAALLVIIVGGLGLTTTLTLSVVERTREIGILSAIGATPRTIGRYVVFEGVLMGVLSWCVALFVTIPITWVLNAVTGNIFIKAPLDLYLSPAAIALWLVLVILLASLASFVPARRSTHLAIREALAYE